MDDTYKMTMAGLARFSARFNELEKRAAKRNLPGVFGYKVVDTFDEEINNSGETRTFHTVIVWGDSPKYDGWRFIGTLDFEDGAALRRMVPGYSLPEEYRDFDHRMCEHCNARRNRKEVFILQHEDGHHKAVGRQCIKDFLGGTSPKELAWFAEMADDLQDAAEDREISDYGSYRPRPFYDPQEVITLAVYSVRLHGWAPSRSRGATRDHVTFLLTPQRKNEEEQDRLRELSEVTDKDRARGARIFNWVMEQDGNGNDFMYNLQTVCGNAVTGKNLGIAVAAVVAYDKAMEREIRRKEYEKKAEASDYVGALGERVDVEGKVDMIRSWATRFGTTTLVKWVDADGNVCVWKSTTSPDVEVGDMIHVRGTIKEHQEYQGAKQTVFTRCKLKVIEPAHEAAS